MGFFNQNCYRLFKHFSRLHAYICVIFIIYGRYSEVIWLPRIEKSNIVIPLDEEHDIDCRIFAWLCVEVVSLVMCGGCSPGYVWRLFTWLCVEVVHLVMCGGCSPGYVWMLFAWLCVEVVRLIMCGGCPPGYVWRLFAWLCV